MRGCDSWGLTLAPYEQTTSYHGGAALGPEALLGELKRRLPGKMQPVRIERIAGRALSSPRPMIRALADAVGRQAAAGLLPVMFGGEHTCTLGPVTALSRIERKLGVVHLDAHADRRASYGGSRYSHASVVRRITDDLSLPALSLGLRAFSAAEARLLTSEKTGLLTGEDLGDWRRRLPPLLHRLPEAVYLTVDMDFFDPSLVPGVGTPEPGGAAWAEGAGIIDHVRQSRRIVGFDIVELCPPRERTKSLETALRVLLAVLCGSRRSARYFD